MLLMVCGELIILQKGGYCYFFCKLPKIKEKTIKEGSKFDTTGSEQEGSYMISVTLPHYTSLEQAITELYGTDKKIVQTSRISGGDINDAYGLKLSDGTRLFMKSNARENVSFFTCEAVGLQAIAMTQVIGTPRILCSGVDEGRGGYAFLLMDFIAGGSRAANYWETLGRQLAAMQQAPTAELISKGNYEIGRASCRERVYLTV